MLFMSMFWAMLIKSLVAFVLFGLALVIAWGVMSLIPEGRIKRLLGRPLRRGIRERKWPGPAR